MNENNEKREINIPVRSGFNATLTFPGSKSVANRALILAALAGDKTVLQNFSTSDDSRYLVEAFRELGMKIDVDEKKMECVVEG